MVGAIPEIYGWHGGAVPLATYFAMARGSQGRRTRRMRPCATVTPRSRRAGAGNDQMVRHQLPLHGAGTAQGPDLRAGLAQADRGIPGSEGAGLPDPPGADRAGHVPEARQEQRTPAFDPLSLLRRGCCRSMSRCCANSPPAARNGCRLDEPCLVLDLDAAARTRLRRAYAGARRGVPQLKIMLATYFGGCGDNLATRVSACRSRACTSISCARRGQIDDLCASAARATACCRSA